MTRPKPQTDLEWRRQIARDVAIQGRRGRGHSLRGTAATRDEHYGIPVTDDEKLALAGSRWLDTDLGLWFTYFAPHTLAGAAPGLRRAGGGWGIQDDSMPSAIVDLQTTQALPTGNTLLSWRTTAPINDPFGLYNTATPTRFMTAPWPGIWQVSYKVRFSTNTGVTTNVKRNAANYSRARSSSAGASGAAPNPQNVFPIVMAVGQYLELEVTPQAAGSIVAGESFVEVQYRGLEFA